MKSAIKLIALLAISIVVTGCASSSILVGTARPAIDPSVVKLYFKPPKKYDEIALVDSSSKSSLTMSDQGKMNVVIRRLKEEAAKVGANGVLIQGRGEQVVGSVSSVNGSTFGGSVNALGIGSNIFEKVGSGLAIFVIEE